MVDPILTHPLAVKISVENYYYVIIRFFKLLIMQSTMFKVITMVAIVLVIVALQERLVKLVVYNSTFKFLV